MNIKTILMAMFAIVFGMSLSACSDDDDNSKSKSMQIDHVKLVAKYSMSQDLADFVRVTINGTVLESDGFTKTYQGVYGTTAEQTLEIPLLKAPGKIEEYISADDEILDAPEIKKSEYHFSYNLSYSLVKVMKDGKEVFIDDNIYNGTKETSSVTVKNDDGTKVSERAVKDALAEIKADMLKERNKKFYVEIVKTGNDSMDEVKITKIN